MAAVFWMLLIFHFSSQEAVDSGNMSGRLTGCMAEGINAVFRLNWDQRAIDTCAGELEYPVRKTAHMTEYAILAWIFLGNCMQYPCLRKKGGFWAWLGTTAYAATDEFHQLFVKGRSGEIKDVMIDSTGALFGLFFAWAVISMAVKRRKEKTDEKVI